MIMVKTIRELGLLSIHRHEKGSPKAPIKSPVATRDIISTGQSMSILLVLGWRDEVPCSIIKLVKLPQTVQWYMHGNDLLFMNQVQVYQHHDVLEHHEPMWTRKYLKTNQLRKRKMKDMDFDRDESRQTIHRETSCCNCKAELISHWINNKLDLLYKRI